MSVIIKGMGLPVGCASCEFNIYGKCIAMGRSLTLTEYRFDDKVSDDCPLVEIPKGARLIDANVLCKDLTRFYDNEVTARNLIYEQPTIFEEDE